MSHSDSQKTKVFINRLAFFAMRGKATPSPTPPTIEIFHISSSSIMSGIPGAMPNHIVGTNQNPWSYSTPPGEEQFVGYPTYSHPSQPNPVGGSFSLAPNPSVVVTDSVFTLQYPQWNNSTIGEDVLGSLQSPCSQYVSLIPRPPMFKRGNVTQRD